MLEWVPSFTDFHIGLLAEMASSTLRRGWLASTAKEDGMGLFTQNPSTAKEDSMGLFTQNRQTPL
jgi:hypothetical protein